MKTTDLMVGDWVLINDAPHKIQAIDSIDAEIQADDELYYVGEDRYHSEDNIEGILITPEILEKNGWKHSNRLMVIRIDGDDFYWSEGFGGVLYKNQYNMCDCKYVHNLQHALRRCWFYELADNFKI